ncbi:MAG: phosphate ABC transporter substrate-binding protein [Candidatus Atribacteria bacterium]|nr:phosphate ABC transporter substrate-binding protein [Candidatus Atribacteria bacterium]
MKISKKSNSIFLVLITLSFVLTSFGILAAEKAIVLKGSTTVLPIAQPCAEVFMDQSPNIDISVQGGGSGVGIASLIDGTCDIGNSSRPAKEEEIKTAKEKGVEIYANIIARDAIAVIVNPANQVEGLTLDQIKDIYLGKISNWSEIGGKDQAIVVVSRDSASGTFETFNELVLKKEKLRPDALMQASNAAVATTVATTRGAIGYVGLGYVTDKVKAIKVNNTLPSKETVNDNSYPLARPLFMYTNGQPEGTIKEFLDFVLGAEGQKLVEENGFLSVQ